MFVVRKELKVEGGGGNIARSTDKYEKRSLIQINQTTLIDPFSQFLC